jgi:hypothetical protein
MSHRFWARGARMLAVLGLIAVVTAGCVLPVPVPVGGGYHRGGHGHGHGGYGHGGYRRGGW